MIDIIEYENDNFWKNTYIKKFINACFFFFSFE